uniref:Protoheme IX farnesyltransferase, mitochondrial n=1 Tax=Schistocephalus solidus TaxID=70667 RepID=A0A183SVJ4_SCHSO
LLGIGVSKLFFDTIGSNLNQSHLQGVLGFNSLYKCKFVLKQFSYPCPPAGSQPSNSTVSQADPLHSSRLLSLSVAGLTNLISSSPTIRKELFTSGAIPLLANCLQSSDPEVLVNALTSLIYLCTPTSQTPALNPAGVKNFQASLPSIFPGLCERVRSLTTASTTLPDRRISVLAEIFLTDCSESISPASSISNVLPCQPSESLIGPGAEALERDPSVRQLPPHTVYLAASPAVRRPDRLIQHTISVCAALSKARLTGLVVSTALAGCTLAAPTSFASEAFLAHPAAMTFSLALGTGLTSAAANTINQIIEVPYDSQMKRTRTRPLVCGLTTPGYAALFAATSGLSGVILLYSALNPLVAGLALTNLILYTSVYTPLKRITQVNTWVGSLVGAIPPLMGWAAATGHLEWGSLMLAALLYCWQFPHFMALSWNLRQDYARAGFVMTANVNPGLCKRTSLRHAVACALVCLAGAGCSAVSLGPWAGWSLGLGSLPLNAALIYYAWSFYKASPEGSSAAARRLFRASLIHLPVVMSAMLICTHWSAAPWI